MLLESIGCLLQMLFQSRVLTKAGPQHATKPSARFGVTNYFRFQQARLWIAYGNDTPAITCRNEFGRPHAILLRRTTMADQRWNEESSDFPDTNFQKIYSKVELRRFAFGSCPASELELLGNGNTSEFCEHGPQRGSQCNVVYCGHASVMALQSHLRCRLRLLYTFCRNTRSRPPWKFAAL